MSLSRLSAFTLDRSLLLISFISGLVIFSPRMYLALRINGQVLDTKINTKDTDRIKRNFFRCFNHDAEVEDAFEKDQVTLTDPIHPNLLVFTDPERDKLPSLKSHYRDKIKLFETENPLIANDSAIKSELGLIDLSHMLQQL